ncbi:MAG: IS3 family transposase [Acidobacteria bacterium]|nr:IS3 family transposase [Acidobacteriota bacterium]
MVRLLEVSRSGHYTWCHRAPSPSALRHERLEAKVTWFNGESDEVSGSPKILMNLREDGEVISKKTVAKMMRRLCLKGMCPKRWKTTTVIDSFNAYPVDAVQRHWDTGALNQVWVRRYLLPAHLGRLALPRDGHRRALATRHWLGD